MATKGLISEYGLENHGLTSLEQIHWNCNTPMFHEEAIRNGEGMPGHIPNVFKDGKAGHPTNVITLTADTFGVMPPVSKPTRDRCSEGVVATGPKVGASVAQV